MRTHASHRLLVTAGAWARLRVQPTLPWLRKAAAALAERAEGWVTARAIQVDETGHNWHLIRARQVQSRVVSLLVRYGQTGDRRFREAALAYIRDLAGWEYWSWITWRENKPARDAIFDLSYGENSLTLALAYDWLADELNEEERALIVDTARERALQPYLARNGIQGQEMWYYRRADCNWNTVCNGGVGMLALALGAAAPESDRVLGLVEAGIRHYFEFLQDDGAWPEGIGYWGYGHRYGYYYLLSRERVDGRPHPLLERPGSQATLRFPLLFSPNGVPASFGDVNTYFPLPFHLAAAARYGLGDVQAELNRRFARTLATDPAALDRSGPWPGLAELLLFHPGTRAPAAAVAWPRCRILKGVEWACLADRWPKPRLYASVRGGTTDAPHTHQDLTELLVVVGAERLIDHAAGSYLDTTFSARRFELYETSAGAKNVLLINGVGLPHPARVAATQLAGDGWEGVLLDAKAAAAFGTRTLACSRAVLMLRGAALLVIDRVQVEHAALAEARFHTFARVRWGRRSAHLTGRSETLHVAFAADVPARLRRGLGLPTQAQAPVDQVLRWVTDGRNHAATLATLLTPHGTGRVRIEPRTRRIRVAGPGFAATFCCAEGPDSGLAGTCTVR
jgi:hypothetical protein